MEEVVELGWDQLLQERKEERSELSWKGAGQDEEHESLRVGEKEEEC